MITAITSQGKTLTVVRSPVVTTIELNGQKIFLTNGEAKAFAEGFLKLMQAE